MVPFLIRSYDIMYAQSAESYLAAETPLDAARLPKNASFAGFAPVFADKDTVPPPIFRPAISQSQRENV